MKNHLLFLLVLISGFSFSQKVSISGYIKDKNTKEVLIGATVYEINSGKGAVTDQNGYFNLSFIKGDSTNFVFSYVGYKKQRLIQVVSASFQTTILLDFSNELKEFEIVGELNKEKSTEISVISIPIEQSKKMPTLFGETDIIRNYQLMPGVSAGAEGTSGLYVRGGSPDQNLFLLDDIPIYNIGHIGGFLSVFDGNAINSVKLYKGGFPAQYGGRLSSVVDLRMKDGNKTEHKKEFSIGTLSSKFSMEGPIKKDTSSYFLSIRRCNADLFTRAISLFESDFEAMAGYTFWDGYGKFNRLLKNGGKLSINFYAGRDNIFINVNDKADNADDFDLKYKSTINWGNILGSIRYTKELSPFLFGNFSLGYTEYGYKTKAVAKTRSRGESNYTEEGNIVFNSGVKDVMFKTKFNYFKFEKHKISTGANLIFHYFTPGSSNYSISSNNSLEEPTVVANIAAFETQLYLDDIWEISPRAKLMLGVHYNNYVVGGKAFNSLQPRMNFNYMLSENSSVKASFVRMNQNIHLLSTSGAGLPSDLWIPATKNQVPEISNQATLGFVKTINKKLELSVEGYYKTMENLIEYKEGTSFFGGSSEIEDRVEAGGTAEIYGVEFLAQIIKGKTTGWIGYTWSKNFRTFVNLNQGNPFPYRYDTRHDFSIVVNHEINENIDFSFTWQYKTGNALTLATSKFQVINQKFESSQSNEFNTAHFYNGRNSYRMAAFHKLDFNFNLRKELKKGTRTWSLGLYNAYSRQNPSFLFYQYDEIDQKTKLMQLSFFPILPSISYSFKFK